MADEPTRWTMLIFWLASATVIYTYFGYPLIVWTLGLLFPRPVHTEPITPSVTILIAAHNEERYIGEKIASCMALKYPPERLDVVVISDGSTDRTVEIVRSYVLRYPTRVTLIALNRHHGKAYALNVGSAAAAGEILFLADARQQFDPMVVHALMRNFADHEVGAVSGELLLLPSPTHPTPDVQGPTSAGSGLEPGDNQRRTTENRSSGEWGSCDKRSLARAFCVAPPAHRSPASSLRLRPEFHATHLTFYGVTFYV